MVVVPYYDPPEPLFDNLLFSASDTAECTREFLKCVSALFSWIVLLYFTYDVYFLDGLVFMRSKQNCNQFCFAYKVTSANIYIRDTNYQIIYVYIYIEFEF